VISDQKFGQSTLTAIANSGNTTKMVPAAAGTYTQRGRSVGRCLPRIYLRSANTDISNHRRVLIRGSSGPTTANDTYASALALTQVNQELATTQLLYATTEAV
jgi:hypothetical protein